MPSIKFTIEKEVNNKLPFLDVLVYHNPLNHSFSFDVYRKPTNKEMYIHYFSYHSSQVKSNIIVNLIIRALRICDPCFIDKEINHIINVFKQLGYPIHFIEKSISRAKRRFYNPTPTENKSEHVNTLTLPYHNQLTQIKTIIERHQKDFRLAFSYNNTISARLVRNRDKVRDNVGVYYIPCSNCDSRYIGETGRSLEIRLEEHKRACRLGLPNSMAARHSLELDHRINWTDSSIIYKNQDISKRRLVEGALINLTKTFEGNKAFTQEDYIINRLVCQFAKIRIDNFIAAPTAQASSLSPAQALASTADAGAETSNQDRDSDAPPSGIREINRENERNLPRRSRRIALRNRNNINFNPDIT